MLRIHQINVAGGDAALLEWTNAGKTFFGLIDTGLQDVGESEDSMRIRCADYLKKKHVSELEFLIITHLHRDHAQALGNVLDVARVKKVYASYFPEDLTKRAPLEPETAIPKVKKLAVDISQYADNIQRMLDEGTELNLVREDGVWFDDGVLTLDFMCATDICVAIQNDFFDNLLKGSPMPESMKAIMAGARNQNSLRVRVNYAGRCYECDGDYYACDAERQELRRCDILKVAHHADIKSMTPALAKKLKPKYAIVSWSDEYKPLKDRPSQKSVDALRSVGATIYYTDCYPEQGQKIRYWEAVVFVITDKGKIIPPKAK